MTNVTRTALLKAATVIAKELLETTATLTAYQGMAQTDNTIQTIQLLHWAIDDAQNQMNDIMSKLC